MSLRTKATISKSFKKRISSGANELNSSDGFSGKIDNMDDNATTLFARLIFELCNSAFGSEVKSKFVGWGFILICSSFFFYSLASVLDSIPAIIDAIGKIQLSED